MEEMQEQEENNLENEAKSAVTYLQFQNPKFVLEELIDFAKQHGWRACKTVMEECLEHNASLAKKDLQPKQLAGLFESRARNYGGQAQQEQQAQEWEQHKQAVVDDDKKAGYAELKAIMDNQLDKGYISHQQYEDAMDFLDKVEQARQIREQQQNAPTGKAYQGRLLGWSEANARMQCLSCGEPVADMKLHATVIIGLECYAGENASELEEIHDCLEWEYKNIFLKCPCGLLIVASTPESFSGKDFVFINLEGADWELRVPKVAAHKAIAPEAKSPLEGE